MPDDPSDATGIVSHRHTLHLPKAKMNGQGVVLRPSGEIRHELMVEEIKDGNSPPKDEEKS